MIVLRGLSTSRRSGKVSAALAGAGGLYFGVAAPILAAVSAEIARGADDFDGAADLVSTCAGSAATAPAAKSNPSADLRGSVEYKREMARVLTGRALHKAIERAGGK